VGDQRATRRRSPSSRPGHHDLRRKRIRRADRLEDVRHHVQAVDVQIGRVQTVRHVVVAGPPRRIVRRQTVFEPDAQRVARPRLDQRSGNLAVVRPQPHLAPVERSLLHRRLQLNPVTVAVHSGVICPLGAAGERRCRSGAQRHHRATGKQLPTTQFAHRDLPFPDIHIVW
jgi:hypothetical protein